MFPYRAKNKRGKERERDVEVTNVQQPAIGESTQAVQHPQFRIRSRAYFSPFPCEGGKNGFKSYKVSYIPRACIHTLLDCS